MKNIVLITSIIDTPNKELSYTNTRSIYNRYDRYQQTKNTIQSIKLYIPNNYIILVECSNFTNEENIYFNDNCDVVINLYNNTELRNKIYSISKSLGEGTMTIQALNYIIDNQIIYNNLFKISGRYFINNEFDYNHFDNDKNNFAMIGNNITNINTRLYKINKNHTILLRDFLLKNHNLMLNCIGYENLIGKFVNSIYKDDIIFLNKLGVSGLIAVDGVFVSD
jgi:hypothetical protein